MAKVIGVFITYIFLEFLMLLDDSSDVFYKSNMVKSTLLGGGYFYGKVLNYHHLPAILPQPFLAFSILWF